MKDALWSAAYELFETFDRLLDKAEIPGAFASTDTPLGGAGASPRAAAKSAKGGEGLRQAFVAVDNLVGLRMELRTRLEHFKALLSERLTERESYLVLFPLVIYFDEVIQARFVTGTEATWPPLQKELFNINNGGEAFYDVVSDLLRKPDTFPFVYEIYYLCLSSGFTGRHADNPTKIKEFTSALARKIPIPEVEAGPGEEDIARLQHPRFPIWSYVAAVAVVAFVYVALQLAVGL
ncbi:DotU family type IV/VI secretion system protein [Planctomycetota bacterium]